MPARSEYVEHMLYGAGADGTQFKHATSINPNHCSPGAGAAAAAARPAAAGDSESGACSLPPNSKTSRSRARAGASADSANLCAQHRRTQRILGRLRARPRRSPSELPG